MKKITLLSLLFTFCITLSFSQQERKNVVKLGIFGLASKNLRFSYERLLTPRISVQMSASFLLKRGLPSSIKDKINDEDTSGSVSATRLDYLTLGGFNFMPEMRLYGKKHGAGKGFYFGPYLKYNKYNLKLGGVSEGNYYTAKGSFSSFGIGINLGTQWTIGKFVSIDWNFLSVGVNFANILIDYNSYSYYTNNIQWANDFNSENASLPLFGKLTATPTANGIQAKTSTVPTLGFASRLAICFRF